MAIEETLAMRAMRATGSWIAAIALLSISSATANPLPLSIEQESALKAGSSFKECDTCPEMVVVPAGRFQMGAEPNERVPFATPRHEVRIVSRFAVSSTEASVAQFAAFIDATGRATRPGCSTMEDVLNGYGRLREGLSWRDPGFPQTPAHPVTCVTWQDAKAYVEWLARVTGKPYRLLSEAEWEYAARAGTTTPYHFGADTGDICLYGNGADKTLQYSTQRPPKFPSDIHDFICSDQHVRTAPVGSFAANPFGLHDMHGNVSEWLEDCSAMLATGRGYQGAPTDGSARIAGDCSTHSRRGGSWGSSNKELRVDYRDEAGADLPLDDAGIRVARDLSQ